MEQEPGLLMDYSCPRLESPELEQEALNCRAAFQKAHLFEKDLGHCVNKGCVWGVRSGVRDRSRGDRK